MREPTLAEKIADTLIHRIITGELAAGERLRQEVYAHEFNTSHVPVREAFLRLEIRRLAISEPRRGVRVAPLEAHDAMEVVRMRGALEIMALRTQKGRPNARQLNKVREALKAGDEASDLVAWEASNRTFHTALAELSLMPRLVACITDLNIAYSRQVFAKEGNFDWKPRSNHDHQRIYDSLASGDIDSAVNLLESHIWAGERYPLQSRPSA